MQKSGCSYYREIMILVHTSNYLENNRHDFDFIGKFPRKLKVHVLHNGDNLSS